MAKELKKVDVVAVGVGFAGGIALAECAKAGLSVVGLERGDRRAWRTFRISTMNGVMRQLRAHAGSVQRDDYVPQYGRNAGLAHAQARFFPARRRLGGAGVHWNGMNSVFRL